MTSHSDMMYIGIDPGTHTGVAYYNSRTKELEILMTVKLHQALAMVDAMKQLYHKDLFVIFEDARQRKWFGNNSAAKLQGAGSVKRDCSIWEEFLTDKKIDFRSVPPIRGGTKWTEQFFREVTGYQGRTSEHSRDAAMLVFGK